MKAKSATSKSASGCDLKLEPVLDLGAAERLHSELLSMRGRALTIDASQVERLGGLCLQVLLSARKTWAVDHQSLELKSPSAAFEHAWGLFAAPAFAAAANLQGIDA